MTPSTRGRDVLCLLIVCAGLMTACGKKGPPLAPLARVAAAPAGVQAARVDNDVYVWFTVPSANVSGQTPADVSSLDLYAFTGVAAPAGEDLTAVAVKIASYAVQPVVPPPPPAPEGIAAPPMPTPSPGFVQGASAVLREVLTDEARVPTPAAVAAGAAAAVEETTEPVPGPLVAPTAAHLLRRYYFVVAVGPRGRDSVPSNMVSVPLEGASTAPGPPTITYTESAMTLTWTPSPNARVGAAESVEPGLLPSRPLVPPPAATGYFVFEVPVESSPQPGDPFALVLPSPLTPQPLTDTTVAVPGPVRFGQRRCFVVRPTDMVGGALVMGAASAPGCLTPADTFPPAVPQQLVAISGVGVINLIWEPNTEADLAGYIVLRGVAPGDTLQALTPAPIRETQYRDQTATPGVRYIYAVVAVDNATPQNVSGQSNRVEDAARQ